MFVTKATFLLQLLDEYKPELAEGLRVAEGGMMRRKGRLSGGGVVWAGENSH